MAPFCRAAAYAKGAQAALLEDPELVPAEQAGGCLRPPDGVAKADALTGRRELARADPDPREPVGRAEDLLLADRFA